MIFFSLRSRQTTVKPPRSNTFFPFYTYKQHDANKYFSLSLESVSRLYRIRRIIPYNHFHKSNRIFPRRNNREQITLSRANKVKDYTTTTDTCMHASPRFHVRRSHHEDVPRGRHSVPKKLRAATHQRVYVILVLLVKPTTTTPPSLPRPRKQAAGSQ